MALDISGSQGAADQAIDTGKTAINSFDPTSTANSQRSSLGSSGLGGLLGGETNGYIGDYAKAVAANPTVTSLYNTANDMFNVPNLQKTATYLGNEVTNAVPSAYAGAKGFDIGNTQVQNGVATRLGYLLPQANAAEANANTASGLAANFVNAGQLQNAQNLLPVQSEQQFGLNTEAAQATGWNQSLASEFQGLIDKMNAGVQLSATEMSRANQLAQLEEAYQQAVDTANIGANAQMRTAQIGNQYQNIPAGNSLINTFTGGAYRAA